MIVVNTPERLHCDVKGAVRERAKMLAQGQKTHEIERWVAKLALVVENQSAEVSL